MSAHTTLPVLGSPGTADQLLDMYYLDMRSALLEAAAAFDRVRSAPGGDAALKDPRMVRLKQACALLADDEPDLARRFQFLLSGEA